MAHHYRGLPVRVVVVVTVLTIIVGVLLFGAKRATPSAGPEGSWAPPAGGYFKLQPVGASAQLPDDARAAAMVHQSFWEIRPANGPMNRTVPSGLQLVLKNDAMHAYDPLWNANILRRITGQYKGTTDEIFQWAAAKWGLPDDLLRTIAVLETDWRQTNQGDYVNDVTKCPPGYVTTPCPVTFGIVGTKTTSWQGIFPWNRDSTAAGVDVLGGWLRGCYEGWVWWLRDHGNTSRGIYRSGDMWGCVGAWFSGDWHDGDEDGNSGEKYVQKAQQVYRDTPWLVPGY